MFLFLIEEIQYHDGLRSRELGQLMTYLRENGSFSLLKMGRNQGYQEKAFGKIGMDL